MVAREALLDQVYGTIEDLRDAVGGPRTLADCTARNGWPNAGVYLFFEDGELRSDGTTPRVVRVGTHAVTATSRTTLWGRLAQHRGTLAGRSAGGGNHRGSVFRRHVGAAIIERDGADAWPGVSMAISISPWVDVRSPRWWPAVLPVRGHQISPRR